ncbi:3D domain-containing protein [Polyangium sorediatum]|uniref:3D domain-containing protein n=1 Tax=Polyangium sorediatum TaxID=889274 RepID=A0ABT6NN67_9BACT|nr:3D domain-containing protein [Polyangium sorediatum]MDI1429772.1 3D domain-containing protein [Polyangium sorediatum]
MRPLTMALVACLSGAACATAAGQAWVQGEGEPARDAEHRGWSETRSARAGFLGQESAPVRTTLAPPDTTPAPAPSPASSAEEVVTITAQGSATGPAASFRNGERFRNTYYDFPKEDAGPKNTTIYDASCKPLTNVTQDFHDRVCVQGSGRLSTGETVSFAKRDCDCASVCPRTSQKICFERLDPARFPTGRGALGKAITPLRSVAVDSSVIPLGTVLFIPEFKGVSLPEGGRHDGCFVAEDRGMKVVGRQIDVFTGDPAATIRLNALVPSNRGVRVYADDARCRSLVARGP